MDQKAITVHYITSLNHLSLVFLICLGLASPLYENFVIWPNKNISVVRVTCQKKLGRVGREIFFFLRIFFILKNVYQFSQVTIFSPVTLLSAV